MVKPGDFSEQEPLFRWDSLREIGPHDLHYQDRSVRGRIFELELASGAKVRAWRAEDGQEYFCHGLTFGGKLAPGGVISPLGDHVPTILRGHYEPIHETQALPGDILVWRGAGVNDVIHSAILTHPVVVPGTNYLAYSTQLQTKNGILPETNMDLGKLVENLYGESYNVYQRRE